MKFSLILAALLLSSLVLALPLTPTNSSKIFARSYPSCNDTFTVSYAQTTFFASTVKTVRILDVSQRNFFSVYGSTVLDKDYFILLEDVTIAGTPYSKGMVFIEKNGSYYVAQDSSKRKTIVDYCGNSTFPSGYWTHVFQENQFLQTNPVDILNGDFVKISTSAKNFQFSDQLKAKNFFVLTKAYNLQESFKPTMTFHLVPSTGFYLGEYFFEAGGYRVASVKIVN